MAKRQPRPTGRPPKWSDPQQLEGLILQYFIECEKDKKMPNKAGLALSLDTTRETLGDYLDKPVFSDAIKRAYAIIEDAWVQRLSAQGQAAGPIFYLKNAYSKDYRDKVEQDITTQGEKITSDSQDVAAIAAEAARLLKQKKT